jgi:hypothetical protein
VCILNRKSLILFEKKVKPYNPLIYLPMSSPMIVCVFSAKVTMFLGISSGNVSERSFLNGLLSREKRLQKLFNSTQEPGTIGRIIPAEITLKHIRMLSYFSFGSRKPNRTVTVSLSTHLPLYRLRDERVLYYRVYICCYCNSLPQKNRNQIFEGPPPPVSKGRIVHKKNSSILLFFVVRLA